MNTACCDATGRKLSTSPGFADTDTLSVNTWNTLPGTYTQRVYTYTPVIVKCQIQKVVNLMRAVFINVFAARVDYAILFDYLTSGIAIAEPDIRNTDSDIPIYNNSRDEELLFGMAGDSGNYEDEGDKSNQPDAIPTGSRRQRAWSELQQFVVGTRVVHGSKGDKAMMRMRMRGNKHR